jgi:microcystin-dependent protein
MSIYDPTIGEITIFAAPWAPKYWALCNGQLLSISSNTALFSIIGTTYGGDGTTTFALPDLRGRFVRGQGQGPGLSPVNMGDVSGTENVSVTTANMPSHAHPHTHVASIHAEARMADQATPADNIFSLAGANIYHDVDDARQDILMHANTVTLATDSTPAGGNMPVGVMNPYVGVNYIIAVQGIYPSRP